MLKETGGDRERGEAGRLGGGTEVSGNLSTRGITPAMEEYEGESRGSWSWWLTLALLRLGGGNLSLELETDLNLSGISPKLS